jgi:hypothetical protein
MSTAQEIEDAIRSLSPSERAKLLPEFIGDQEWDRLVVDKRPRPALGQLLDSISAFPQLQASSGVTTGHALFMLLP